MSAAGDSSAASSVVLVVRSTSRAFHISGRNLTWTESWISLLFERCVDGRACPSCHRQSLLPGFEPILFQFDLVVARGKTQSRWSASHVFVIDGYFCTIRSRFDVDCRQRRRARGCDRSWDRAGKRRIGGEFRRIEWNISARISGNLRALRDRDVFTLHKKKQRRCWKKDNGRRNHRSRHSASVAPALYIFYRPQGNFFP